MESGAADMVSMVRALIADPELVNKARRGEENRIRPCIGSSIGCVGQLMSTGVLSCVVNVAAAKETTVSFEPEGVAAVPKRVLVVGGGPAGLEAARTAALRGHEVELHEATRRLGGQVAIAASAPHRSDIGAITEWLVDEIERLGVTIRLSSMVEPDIVDEVDPDEVIVATGSTPRRDGFQLATPVTPIPGHDLAHVYTLVGRLRLRRPGRGRGTVRRLRRHRDVRGDLGRRRPAGDGSGGDHGRPLREHRRHAALPAGHRGGGAGAADVR